jgi:hypothetical protein
VTALLLGSALAGLLALSWLHLRPSGVRAALPVPSLQHLRGPSPKRRRALPLEELLPWGLRAAALVCALGGTWASRAGCAADVRPVAVVDAAASSRAWVEAQALAPTRLGFAGEKPVAEGDGAGLLVSVLGACSDTRAACLLRAADRSGRPLLLVGDLAADEWRLPLARRAQAFSFLRTEGEAPPPPAERLASQALAEVRLEGTAAAARLWAAALAAATSPPLPPAGGAGPRGLPEVVVVDARPPPLRAPAERAALTVFSVDGPGPAQPEVPAVRVQQRTGLLFPDPLDLAAGTAGLGLVSSLSLEGDGRFLPVLGFAARSTSKAELALAATGEELAEWAHQGNLLPLARALLASGLEGPTEVGSAPAGGGLGWTDTEGRAAPVGLLDVAPGRYLRADGRVRLQLARAQVPAVQTLYEKGLTSLGGRPWADTRAARVPLPTLLFSLALALFLAGAFLTRGVRRAWLPAAAVALALVLLLADVRWHSEATAPYLAILAVSPGAAARALTALAREASVTLRDGRDAATGRCAAPWAEVPCTPLATVAWASLPAAGADTLLFDTEKPRVDVLSVEAPKEVALGTAAEVWVTLRVRRAAGRHLTLAARCTAAAPASVDWAVEGTDVVRTLRLVLSPLQAGVGFVAVEARVEGEAQAEDGRLFALSARLREERRLVLAAAPGWEARAAAAALEARGARVDVLSLLGTRAVVARGRTAQAPRDVLRDAQGLEGVGLLALVGFGPRELDAAAAAGLRRYVESGGAALVLDAPGAAAALGVEVPKTAETAPLQPLLGQLAPLDALRFRGYAAPPGLTTAPGLAVLGRLGLAGETETRPWVVGRALGQGRVAVVTAPDVWRLSPPGEGRDAYQRVLAHLVGWLEAPVASRHGAVLSEDWASLRLEEGPGAARLFPLPTADAVDGLPVDALDVATLNHSPRAALRALAAGARHPFLEVEGTQGLASAWGRLPAAPRVVRDVRVRTSVGAFAALAALLVLEAVARRRYGGSGGSGSRANSAASPEETGGMTSGEGNNQRASETAASPAAARSAAPSVPA